MRNFRGNKFSREFIFEKKGKFAKISSREIFKKRAIHKIRENLFRRNDLKKTFPRNLQKFDAIDEENYIFLLKYNYILYIVCLFTCLYIFTKR